MTGAWAAMCAALLVAGMAPAPMPRAAPNAGAALVPGRDFGLFPGAVVVATVRVRLPPGAVLDRSSLPVPGPVDPETDLRRVTWHATPDNGGTLVAMRLTYQLFYAPQHLQSLAVPGFALGVVRRGRHEDVAVRGFAVSISPFRQDLTPSLDPGQMRPDVPPLGPAPAGGGGLVLAGGVLAALSVLALVVARALGGRRGAGSFAAAYRAVRRGGLDERGALLAVHRAFDAEAGRRVLAEDVDAFVAAHRQFSALREEIAAFFAYSNHVFYGAGGPAALPVLPLARALARAERA